MSNVFIVLFTIAALGAYVCSETQKCPANSQAILCGSICQRTCEQPMEITCKVDPKQCKIECKCFKGFVNNTKTNQCVKLEDCPEERPRL